MLVGQKDTASTCMIEGLSSVRLVATLKQISWIDCFVVLMPPVVSLDLRALNGFAFCVRSC